MAEHHHDQREHTGYVDRVTTGVLGCYDAARRTGHD
jgi:hypothetical protein